MSFGPRFLPCAASLLLLCYFFPTASHAAAGMPRLKLQPDAAVVSIDLPPHCRFIPLEAGGIRLEGVENPGPARSLPVKRQGLERIEWRPRGQKRVDLFALPTRDLAYRAGRFRDGTQSGFVIHFFYPEMVRRMTPAVQAARQARAAGLPVVLLDPGHGGHDPGTSHHGLQEKNLTLNFARKLRDELQKRKRVYPLLTRTDDRFFSLAWRRHFAERVDADLFLSIHVNANTDQRVSGLEIYLLSTEESRDEAARRLEGRENLNFLGDERNMLALDDTLTGILVDMQRLNQLRQSARLAALMKKQFQGLAPWAGSCPVRGARFRVLLHLAAPAALLELGYITHAGDRSFLQDKRKMETLVRASARSIEDFFSADAPEPSSTSEPRGFHLLTVQQGDTLEGIARRTGQTVKELQRRNQLADPDALTPGQVLVVPY